MMACIAKLRGERLALRLMGCLLLLPTPFATAADAAPVAVDQATMMAWITRIDEQGIRLPGYVADEWMERWGHDQFVAFGLQDVRLEPFEVLRWEAHSWSLRVWPRGRQDDSVMLSAWPVPLSGNATALHGELALTTADTPPQPGLIAVEPYRLMQFDQAHMRDEVARWHYDPDGDFDTLQQTVPMGPRFQHVLEPAMAAGAKAWIGILEFPWQEDRYFVPYDAKLRDMPGLYLSQAEGQRLLALMAQGPVEARVNVHREARPAISHNVVGVLPGRSDEWIIIGTHHDGPWNSAVEDASGVALVMAQAQYWAQVPQDQRPHNMMFLLQGGHMSRGAGLHHTAKTYAKRLRENTVAVIHLEHAAREAHVVDGALIPGDKPEVRWWFTSHMPQLEQVVSDAICAHQLDRSLLMPPYGWPKPEAKRPPTDASVFFLTTPVISLLAAPMYLFDPADRVDMVHEASLEPITAAVIDMVNGLADTSAAALHASEYQPPQAQRLPGCEAGL